MSKKFKICYSFLKKNINKVLSLLLIVICIVPLLCLPSYATTVFNSSNLFNFNMRFYEHNEYSSNSGYISGNYVSFQRASRNSTIVGRFWSIDDFAYMEPHEGISVSEVCLESTFYKNGTSLYYVGAGQTVTLSFDIYIDPSSISDLPDFNYYPVGEITDVTVPNNPSDKLSYFQFNKSRVEITERSLEGITFNSVYYPEYDISYITVPVDVDNSVLDPEEYSGLSRQSPILYKCVYNIQFTPKTAFYLDSFHLYLTYDNAPVDGLYTNRFLLNINNFYFNVSDGSDVVIGSATDSFNQNMINTSDDISNFISNNKDLVLDYFNNASNSLSYSIIHRSISFVSVFVSNLIGMQNVVFQRFINISLAIGVFAFLLGLVPQIVSRIKGNKNRRE